MLVLLLCAVLGEYIQPGAITQSVQSLRPRLERTYKDAPNNFLAQLLITFFRIGTLAMALCLCLCADDAFTLTAFAALCGVVFVVLAVKMLCDLFVDYTFMVSRRFMPLYEHYANIFTITTCVLYPCLLVMLRVGSTTGSRWVLGIVAVLFLLMWLYRSSSTFINSPIAILYYILYIVTLEVLPIGGILYLSMQTLALI